MQVLRLTIAAFVTLLAAPVSTQDDKPAGEQFQFQADVNKVRAVHERVWTWTLLLRNADLLE